MATFQATIKATGETIRVYKLHDQDFYDYDNMGEDKPPAASKAGKKKFSKEELINIIQEK